MKLTKLNLYKLVKGKGFTLAELLVIVGVITILIIIAIVIGVWLVKVLFLS